MIFCSSSDTLHAFQTVQNASSQAIDTGTIRAAQVEIGQANQLIQEMEDSYRRAAEQEERLNNGIRNGTNAADGMLGKVKSIAASMATAWGAQKIIDLSDQMTSTTARLSFLVDDGGSVASRPLHIFFNMALIPSFKVIWDRIVAIKFTSNH